MNDDDASAPSIALFIIDSAKDYDDLVQQSHAVWSHLRPGSVVLFSDFLYPISCPDDDKKGGSSRRGTVPGFVYSSLVEPGLFQLLWVFPRTSEVAFEVTDHYDPQRGLE
jgi:hypothetical protein